VDAVLVETKAPWPTISVAVVMRTFILFPLYD
jgi:hypothetical protein